MRGLMETQFTLASDAWEIDQQLLEVKAMQQGGSALGARHYRVTMAAAGVVENYFFGDLHNIWALGSMWSVINETDATEELNAIIFRCLSRQGATVQKLIADRHRKTPSPKWYASACTCRDDTHQ